MKTDLLHIGARFALVGGIAVSARSVPRFTMDADFAVAVDSDAQAENLISMLFARGYVLGSQIEQEAADRLGTVRLWHPLIRVPRVEGPLVDLLFSSCGIERETVQAATPMEVFRGVVAPVAPIPHLIAMKVLSANRNRLKDEADIHQLLKAISPDDMAQVRSLLELIIDRGFDRGKDLRTKFDRFLEQ